LRASHANATALRFDEPVKVFREGPHFVVWTSSGSRGGNFSVRVDRRTGAVGPPKLTPK